jgi:hypothetical protein
MNRPSDFESKRAHSTRSFFALNCAKTDVLFEPRAASLAVEFRRVPLDVGRGIRAARASGMPNVEVWAGAWMA